MDKLSAVKMINFFEGLPNEKFKKLAEISHIKTFNKGELLFEADVHAHGFFAPITGRVKIFRTSPSGKEQILHIFGPGEAFGEVPVFEGGTFPAHGQAIEKCKALFFPRNDFEKMIKDDPDLAMKMMAMLSQRLRILVNKIDELSLKEAPSRVASYLLLLRSSQDSDTFKLDLPKGQIAFYLGTIQETLSRIFKRLTEDEIIEIDGKEITIIDRNRLETLANEGR
ncbi:Transcriptional regulator, Crp/Fnr family [Pseudodesulfovibrio profundus]|uniref:Transcriptional regulator, Crp/Fnr family n=1 Tax=Pseudodesulfovibrio profundus TaxID=57320 RepID=A0A2C8F6Q0_9BACT|nr:Crp/Fnr family transcriptional regulator [Pseudodesulfovibrio profundus]SOB57708.1 Transcriptional regulator, Crp/Fnr family [Pseudodesulfovibrio profundus]|tara:strand:+ start:153 stop:827 length:675 start_codon:yes stop_codon:yes gene_type:complete